MGSSLYFLIIEILIYTTSGGLPWKTLTSSYDMCGNDSNGAKNPRLLCQQAKHYRNICKKETLTHTHQSRVIPCEIIWQMLLHVCMWLWRGYAIGTPVVHAADFRFVRTKRKLLIKKLKCCCGSTDHDQNAYWKHSAEKRKWNTGWSKGYVELVIANWRHTHISGCVALRQKRIGNKEEMKRCLHWSE